MRVGSLLCRWLLALCQDSLLKLHPLLGVVVPVEELLVLYELGVLGVGQLATKLVRLQEVQEMEALWISKRDGEDTH